MGVLSGLTPEFIGSGIVGVLTAGLVARGVILGYMEARGKMKETEKATGGNPLVQVTGAIWDKDQVERFLQYIERIGEVLEQTAKYTCLIADAQGILSDNFQQSTQSKLNDLLELVEKAEQEKLAKPKPRPRPKRKPKSSS